MNLTKLILKQKTLLQNKIMRSFTQNIQKKSKNIYFKKVNLNEGHYNKN